MMDNQKKTRKKPSTKLLEFLSSRETTPDPFSDDGEYGSDVDYDPDGEKEGDSSSNVGDSQSNTNSEHSDSSLDSEDSEYSSSESIFDSHKRKFSTSKESQTKKCKLQTKQKFSTSKESKTKNSKPENDKDSDINSVVSLSINSEVLSSNIDVLNLQDSFLLKDLTDIEVQSQLLSDNHTTKDQASSAQPSLALPECSNIEGNITSVIPSVLSRDPTSIEGNSTVNVQSQSPLPGSESHVQLCLPPLDPANAEGNLTPSSKQHTASPDFILCPSLDPANTEGSITTSTQQLATLPDPQACPILDPANGESNLTSSLQQHASTPSPIPISSLDSANMEGNLTPTVQQHAPLPDPLACSQSSLPTSESTPGAPSLPAPSFQTQSRSRTLTPVNEEDNLNLENETDTTERRQRNFSPEPAHDWENTTTNIPIFEFDETSTGVQFEITPDMSPLDVFNKLFPQHIIEYIVAKTNEYGRALCNTNRRGTRNTRTRQPKFKDIDSEEMKKFLGLCLLMGQVKVPQKRKLFTYSDPLYYHPVFQYVMSARRFEQILRCVCVSELNSKGKEKIVKFIDLVTRTFRECYKPSKELSLDESLLLFRGRLCFRQYIKNKKAKYGIKFYELTTSDGFVLNILMYAGKEEDDRNVKGKKTEKIVMHLMRPYLLKGHYLFMDNYYNSVELSQKLVELGTHTTGTLRSNRKGNPTEIVKKKLKKGGHVWVRKHKVYVSKWVDKRSVLMITTLKHPKLTAVSNRHGQIRTKPVEVAIYNDFMSGIDRSDQMISYYSSPRKSLRWYKKVFFHLLDLAVWNSFYIYKRYCKNNDKRFDFLTFREALIRSLVQLSPNIKPTMLQMHRNKHYNRLGERCDSVPSNNDENNIGYGHWPEKIPVKAGSKKPSNYMKCKMCSKKKIRRETGLRCKGCPDKPALCAICFEEWHNRA